MSNSSTTWPGYSGYTDHLYVTAAAGQSGGAGKMVSRKGTGRFSTTLTFIPTTVQLKLTGADLSDVFNLLTMFMPDSMSPCSAGDSPRDQRILLEERRRAPSYEYPPPRRWPPS